MGEYRNAPRSLATLGMTVLALLLGMTMSCDLGTITVSKTTPSVVVHAVLNPNATNQVVLLERTLTGAVNVPDTSFDANDPIASGGGIPISGAVVEIIDSAGRVVRGVEDITTTTSGKGAGVYRVPLIGSNLVIGARYRLHVRTLTGEDVTGSTRIPSAATRATGGLSRTFNRDHDAVVVQWNPVDGASSYFIRVESPFAPFFLFTDSMHFRMSGDLRNVFAGDLQRVFIPGFRQDMVIAAVDANFYDYYRTANDPFTGSGIINRIVGGIGLFGSMVELNTGTVNVVADQTQPVEGRFRLAASDLSTVNTASQVVLYVESPPAREDLPASLSGRYTTGGPNPRSDGIVGQQLGSTVTIALLVNQVAADTLDLFTGELRGDTLVGTYRRAGGTTRLVRSP